MRDRRERDRFGDCWNTPNSSHRVAVRGCLEWVQERIEGGLMETASTRKSLQEFY